MSGSAEVYDRLVEILHGYLSPASVTAALSATLERRGLSPPDVGRGELPDVVADAMVGLRMFCDPERIGDLMMDLAEYCEAVAAEADDAS